MKAYVRDLYQQFMNYTSEMEIRLKTDKKADEKKIMKMQQQMLSQMNKVMTKLDIQDNKEGNEEARSRMQDDDDDEDDVVDLFSNHSDELNQMKEELNRERRKLDSIIKC